MEAEKSSGRPIVWRVAGWVLFCCMGFAGGIPVHAEAVPEPVRETVQAGPVAETQGMTRYADVPVRLVREKAQAGDEVAQLELGLRYLHGIEGVRDVPAGVRWIEKAASSGMLPCVGVSRAGSGRQASGCTRGHSPFSGVPSG